MSQTETSTSPDSGAARRGGAPIDQVSASDTEAFAQMEQAPERVDERYSAVKQYSLSQIIGVWAAAAVPMAVLAWIVAPLLRHQLSGAEPLAQALLICMTLGLIWQFALVLILMRRELGTLRWSRLRDALWLRPPRDPKTGRVGGKVYWWALPFGFLAVVWALVPQIPGPSVRDFGDS